MAMKKWVVAQTDKALAKQLAEECDIDPFAALIAVGRGYTDSAELEQFLSDDPQISDPHELADIEKAAACINSSIADGVKIAVYGDYDCDGITATAMLYDYLISRGADAVYRIPNRETEGYGMNATAVEELARDGVGLIVTVDNGISCAAEVAHACSLGLRVVVTDHHIPPENIPEAEAVVDPHRNDCPSSFKEICGAQVAFKLICVLDGKEPEELLERYADLLAIAVLGDIMPLKYENRGIVRAGLKMLKSSPRTGLAALMSVGAIQKSTLNAGRVTFGIVPRINASGRMGDASRAVKLLGCTNMLEALTAADELDKENSLRQQTEKEIFAKCTELIEKNGYQYNRVIVVSGEGWHHGIVGIVASRITERYARPSIVLSTDGESAQGSGRSYSGFSLYDAVSSCSELLIKFGGHELAAGMSLKTSDIAVFRERINTYAYTIDYVPPVLTLDCRLNPSALSVDLAESVKALEPFGIGNPAPLFGIFGVTLKKIIPLKEGKHIKLLLSNDKGSFQALLFGVTPDAFCFEADDVLDVAVSLDTNVFNGIVSLSVIIKAIRLSGTDDDRLFTEIESYNSYRSGGEYDAAALLPSRTEVGSVYKFISAAPVAADRIKYIFSGTVGYAKTMIAVNTLVQLGLVSFAGGRLTASASGEKKELISSPIYRELCERSER